MKQSSIAERYAKTLYLAAKKVGNLDDYFFVYFEDADWSIRIKNAGYKLGLNFNSKIYHHE